MNSGTVIRAATRDDAAALSGLAMRSKAHWGYDAAFMALCRAELTMTPERIADEEVIVAESGEGAILGFGSYVCESDTSAEILNCFVEPATIGRGVFLGKNIAYQLSDSKPG